MGMRNDSQNPCLDRYLRGMEQRERNRKRRRNARLKRLLKEAAICIGAAVLTAGGLLYMILNDPYELLLGGRIRSYCRRRFPEHSEMQQHGRKDWRRFGYRRS